MPAAQDFVEQGLKHLESGQLEAAKDCFRRALALDATNVRARALLNTLQAATTPNPSSSSLPTLPARLEETLIGRPAATADGSWFNEVSSPPPPAPPRVHLEETMAGARIAPPVARGEQTLLGIGSSTPAQAAAPAVTAPPADKFERTMVGIGSTPPAPAEAAPETQRRRTEPMMAAVASPSTPPVSSPPPPIAPAVPAPSAPARTESVTLPRPEVSWSDQLGGPARVRDERFEETMVAARIGPRSLEVASGSDPRLAETMAAPLSKPAPNDDLSSWFDSASPPLPPPINAAPVPSTWGTPIPAAPVDALPAPDPAWQETEVPAVVGSPVQARAEEANPETLLREASSWHRRGDLWRTSELAARALAQGARPDDVAAQLEASQVKLLEVCSHKLGSLGATPRPRVTAEQLNALKLSAPAAFVLSRVDGMATYEDLLGMGGIPRLVVALALTWLVENQIIAV